MANLFIKEKQVWDWIYERAKSYGIKVHGTTNEERSLDEIVNIVLLWETKVLVTKVFRRSTLADLTNRGLLRFVNSGELVGSKDVCLQLLLHGPLDKELTKDKADQLLKLRKCCSMITVKQLSKTFVIKPPKEDVARPAHCTITPSAPLRKYAVGEKVRIVSRK